MEKLIVCTQISYFMNKSEHLHASHTGQGSNIFILGKIKIRTGNDNKGKNLRHDHVLITINFLYYKRK